MTKWAVTFADSPHPGTCPDWVGCMPSVASVTWPAAPNAPLASKHHHPRVEENKARARQNQAVLRLRERTKLNFNGLDIPDLSRLFYGA